MSKVFILFTIFLHGCTVGNADFQCSEGSENGICASASTIYHATNGELKENETLTYFKNGESKQITLQELKRIRNEQNSVKLENYTEQPSKSINIFDYDEKAVRTPPTIMRIWIAPWVSKEDVLSMSKVIFTDMNSKQWKFGQMNSDNNSYLSIFKSTP